ncbi:MAG: cysteine--tRNA ligase [Candidatus Daviesbacteria bacterium]|nr:cysteine--tRNA ligase [Candidatus Daviesbacteria bacterium]
MQLYNSLGRSLENFKSLHPKKVTVYVCGITPYDTTHLGHAFTYISFDVLIRHLKFQGYSVEYTQNVTDINDRDNDILKRAKEQNIPWQDLSDFWTKKFLEDMQTLNWIKPTHFLFASKNIKPMITLIQKLLKKSFAYQAQGSVYLDITKFPNFGELSKLNEEQMLKIAKDFEEDIENPDKKHPLDITLWRAATDLQPKHIPSFNSPFSKGRPGWHMECSAMAISSLGERIDIHGGGIDLLYPHHSAEIVQSEGATGRKPFVKYWLHTGAVSYQGEKMSKSLGNMVMVSDLLKKYSANTIRWVLLSHHYQTPWEFYESELEEAEITIKSLKLIKKKISPEFTGALDNNLDTPQALELIKKTNSLAEFKLLGFN